jgi:hypothetical protein
MGLVVVGIGPVWGWYCLGLGLFGFGIVWGWLGGDR